MTPHTTTLGDWLAFGGVVVVAALAVTWAALILRQEFHTDDD